MRAQSKRSGSISGSMKESLLQFLSEHGYRAAEDNCLVAVSGGLDSMVLATLFHECGIRFSIAHVNHGLRGEESDTDEVFVKDWAEARAIPFHCLHINLDELSRTSGLGYQEAGRKIRYEWFEELCRKHLYRFVVTAHHANDRAETVLHRIIRGTGIAGLQGIPPQRDAVLRPLLAFSRNEILNYAQSQAIKWREDSSNQSTDYTRNQIRLQVLPLLEELNPSAVKSILNLANEAVEVQAFLNDQAEKFWNEHASPLHGAYAISKFRVHPEAHGALLLSIALRRRGFYPLVPGQLTDLMDSLSGKQLVSGNLRLYNDRDYLYLVDQRNQVPESGDFQISASLEGFPEGWTLEVLAGPVSEFATGSCAYFDLDLLQFPLILRRWQQGDRIRPYGLHGSMKVSDILTQAKVPLFLKERQPVLLSGETVIWVPGFRIASETSVNAETRRILKISSPVL